MVSKGANTNLKKNNLSSNKKNKQSIVPFTTPKSVPEQKTIQRVNVNPYKMSPDANRYKEGLLNPFSETAIGSRVPDQFFAPTVTYAFREYLTVKADANGEADVVICPSPQYIAFSTRNSIANGTTLTLKDGSSYAQAQYINTSAAFSTKVSNYRIVNWGIRIRQTQSINTAQGTVTAALFVPRDDLPHPSVGSATAPVGNQSATGANWSSTTMGSYLVTAGLPSDGTGTTAKIAVGSLVDYPYHMRASCVNAAENTYEVLPKLVSPRAYGFRGCTDTPFGTDITGQTSLAFIQPGDSAYINVDGWTGIVLGATGLVANSSGAFDVEIIYNIEGNPQLSSSGAPITGIASTMKSAQDPIGMLIAQAALDSMPAFRLLNGARAAFKAFSS